MKDKEKFTEVINKLASDTPHWLEVKKILEEDIRGMQDIIQRIDKAVLARENKMSKLN